MNEDFRFQPDVPGFTGPTRSHTSTRFPFSFLPTRRNSSPELIFMAAGKAGPLCEDASAVPQ